MVNKKGYIKTLEAVIAIVIILIFTFAVTPKPQPSYALPSSVENAQQYILEEIAGNEEIRIAIMAADMDNLPTSEAYGLINDIVSANMPTGFDYAIGICEESACAETIDRPLPADKSIYTAEEMIGSGGDGQTPRIVRLWMWRK